MITEIQKENVYYKAIKEVIENFKETYPNYKEKIIEDLSILDNSIGKRDLTTNIVKKHDGEPFDVLIIGSQSKFSQNEFTVCFSIFGCDFCAHRIQYMPEINTYFKPEFPNTSWTARRILDSSEFLRKEVNKIEILFDLYIKSVYKI